MKKYFVATMICFSALFGVFFCTNDTYAQSFISSVSYMKAPHCGNHNNKWKSTVFSVKFNWGSNCPSGKCSIVDNSFHCVTHGAACSTKNKVKSISVSKDTNKTAGCYHTAKYTCYKVRINVKKGYQDAVGYIRRVNQYALTVKHIDTDGKEISSGEYQSGIWYGDARTVSSRDLSGIEYSFAGWRTSLKGGIVSQANSYRTTITGNTTLYAVYEKVIPKNDCAQTYTGNETFTRSFVKNKTVDGEGSDWKEGFVYAKPTDAIGWRHCYYPGVQKLANETITDKDNNVKKISDVITNWENKYSMNTKNFSSDATGFSYSFEKGDSKSQIYDDNSYDSVEGDKVGKELTETITTGKPIKVAISGNTYNVDEGPTSSEASVRVPYNFLNRTSVVKDNDNDVVYAGSSNGIKIKIANLPKSNSVTNGTYATKSEVRYKMRTCTMDGGENGNNDENNDTNEATDEDVNGIKGDESEEEVDEGFGDIDETAVGDPISDGYGTCNEEILNTTTLNSSSKETGDSTDVTGSVSIPDLKAGSEVCVQSAVFPKDSGSDDNMQPVYDGYDINNPNDWAYSQNVVCYTVAKKPNLQVWGGNIYSTGNINTSSTIKNIGGKEYAFGSWGELGVISGGLITDFVSGAATGYSGNDEKGNLKAEPGGGSADPCMRSVLTFSNNDCDKTGLMNISISNNRVIKDKKSIVEKIVNNTESSGFNRIEGDTVGPLSLGRGELKLMHIQGSIYIKGNIEFNDIYTSLSEMSKMVIYAEGGDIYIDCSVTRIDALLMADGVVRTCVKEKKYDKEGNLINDGDVSDIELKNKNLYVPLENAESRSNQLTINGAIIANKLIADRTYGAATGNNSIVPAEIINFDPSLYLWGGDTTEEEVTENSDSNLNIVYSNELSPRK